MNNPYIEPVGWQCPKCGHFDTAPDSMRGEIVRCRCGHEFPVPGVPQEELRRRQAMERDSQAI